MSPLLKIRAERDQMSAIERRIADYILENAHLLRDYSSQQLANALGISQSSVVKFSQKLGFKGYPDLKYSIGEALARRGAGELPGPAEARPANPHVALPESLWRGKAAARQETLLINPQAGIDAVVQAINGAGKVFLAGAGEDALHAQLFAYRLSLLGIATMQHADAALMAASLPMAESGDVLLAFSEHGKQPVPAQLSHEFQAHGGTVVSVTRHTANPLRAHADMALLISAHDERPYVEPLLYHAALQHLLDLVLVLLYEGDDARRERFDANLERVRRALAP